MRHLIILLLLLLSPAVRAQTNVQEHTLSNGMKVWLNPDTTAAKIFGAVVVNAGSVHSPDTGIAHYLEHMAFKGTTSIGTTDYSKEKPLLDSIEVLYNLLPAAKSDFQRDSIQKAINRLSIKSAEYIIPNEFGHLITKYGGSGLNAYTSYSNTVYHNSFTPQYLEQWCMLNAERLIHPVFRLFQSELETVYEEKNMNEDRLGETALNRLWERSYAPSPYMYSVLGSTYNLKNPSLSKMKEFYKKYYTAGNMSLVLCGNFNPEEALPIIEKTFSKIPSGPAFTDIFEQPEPLKGRESFRIKLPIPIVNGTLLGFHIIPSIHPDYIKIEVIKELLSNSQMNGLIDRLRSENKIMDGMVEVIADRNIGIIGIAAIAKPVIQSKKGTEKRLLEVIGSLKNGNFPQRLLESVKQNMMMYRFAALETVDSRSQVLIEQLSNKQSFNDYINQINHIRNITRQDIIDVANKYFTGNYLAVNKKTGNYPKEYLPKPDILPIKLSNKGISSEYAKSLEKIPVPEISPKFTDLVPAVKINPLTELYITKNNLNDLFQLNLYFAKGTMYNPALKPLANYLLTIGSRSLPFTALTDTLSGLGIIYNIAVSGSLFEVMIKGPDKNMAPALEIIADLLYNPAPSRKEIRKQVKMLALEEKTQRKDINSIAGALLQKTLYGDTSKYIYNITSKELSRYNDTQLLENLNQVLKSQLTIRYFGKSDSGKLTDIIKKNLRLEDINAPAGKISYPLADTYRKPVIYIVDMPKSKQSIIYSCQIGKPVNSEEELIRLKTLQQYIGGSMTSLLFQQIREMRSLAYGTSAAQALPTPVNYGKPPALVCALSTQTDKTSEATALLDSLLKSLPSDNTVAESAIQAGINKIYNDYPSPRNITSKVFSLKINGYEDDPDRLYYKIKDKLSARSLIDTYNEFFSSSPIIYMITGDIKKIDTGSLGKLGEIIVLDKKSLFKKN